MNITKEQAALARAVLKDFADEQRRKARVAFDNYRTSASTVDKSAFVQANEDADNAEYVAKRMQATPPKPATPQPDGGDGAVAWRYRHWNADEDDWHGWIYSRCEPTKRYPGSEYQPLYTRPSAAAVVPEIGVELDWPELPRCWTGSPVAVRWDEDGTTTAREVYTGEQMRIYARTCWEAMLAAAPAAPRAEQGGQGVGNG